MVIIGIIGRKDKTDSGLLVDIMYNDISKAIRKSGGIPIGIRNNNILDYIDICDGFILQGGSEIDTNNYEVIKEIKKRDKPLLGICLGMQEMAMYHEGIMLDIPNHFKKHLITIKEDSLLYRIVNKDKIMVNSRHKSAIKKTSIDISSYSIDDYIIESVEDKNCKFFLGVEWHPENMYDSDENSKKIFDYFIDVCKKE